jgi:2-polyprenyl-3-methyl-5-hydroxy-6-metoxy-1,4-benzoquinol methylase
VPLDLWKRARQAGVDLEILGLDVSSTACDYAGRLCREAAGAIRFQQADVTRDALPMGYDIVTCSLFLHHLSCAQVSALLKKMGAAGRLLVVSDLRRCAAGYALAQVACRLATTSPVVRWDGPQSVANAFTLAEMRALCEAAGLIDATVRADWPCRLMVIRQRS